MYAQQQAGGIRHNKIKMIGSVNISSHTKLIGDIGTSMAVAEFLKHGINVLIPYDDNSAYDLVIYINNKFYKIQVKTTEKVLFNEYMQFSLKRTDPHNGVSKSYNPDEVDYFVLYCVENNWLGMISINEYRRTLTIRFDNTKNNQKTNINFIKYYDMHNRIKEFFNKNYLTDNIIHDEKRKQRKKKEANVLCPICNENYIKKTNLMCRECYLKSIRKE